MQHAPASFTTGSVTRHVMAMATTSALSLLALFVVDILTLVYVSMLHDQTLLAAAGLAKTLIFINGAFASGLILAAGAVVSARTARNDVHHVPRLVTHMLLMVLIVAGTIAALELATMAHLARWLGADIEVYREARTFIWIALPASVAVAAMQMCAQMLRAQGHIRLALMVVLSGALVLALADPLFIFALDLGLEGAGIAYLLSAVVSLVLGLVLVRRHVGLSTTLSLKLLRVHARLTLKMALPPMLANLAMPVGITYLMLVMVQQGTAALAGMAVIDRVLQLGYCVFFALPGALVPVMAQNLGAGRDERTRHAIVTARRLVLLYGFSLWLLLIVFGPAIGDYFELQGAGREMFLAFCRYGAGAWVLFGLDFVAQSVFLTTGHAWWIAVFGWLRGTAGTVPFVFAGAHWFGGSGALIGMWCGNGLVAAAAITVAAVQARRFFAARGIAAAG